MLEADLCMLGVRAVQDSRANLGAGNSGICGQPLVWAGAMELCGYARGQDDGWGKGLVWKRHPGKFQGGLSFIRYFDENSPTLSSK